jgi:hypothetical protein
MDQSASLETIGKRLEQSVKEHSTRKDGFWYTAMTIFPLVLSTFSSIAAKYPELAVCVSIASAIAALCIGLERTLGLGARWRYHCEMKAAYMNLQDGIEYLNELPLDRRQAFLNDWWSRLVAIRAREGQIPNTAGTTAK